MNGRARWIPVGVVVAGAALAALWACGGSDAAGPSDGGGPGGGRRSAAAVGVGDSIPADRDTYIAATDPNHTRGARDSMVVEPVGRNRLLVRIIPNAVAARVGSDSLISATLELTVKATSGSWGTGRTLKVHRVTHDWVEANATWSCAKDTVPANGTADCTGANVWDMATEAAWPWVATPTATFPVSDGLSGVVRIDLTADVRAFLTGTPSYGWVIKGAPEGAGTGGRISFWTKEAASFSNRPRLVLVTAGTSTGTHKLFVVRHRGVTGSPAADTVITSGAHVSYGFSLAPGYQSLNVWLDGVPAPTSGTVTADTTHVLEVSADTMLSVPPAAATLHQRATALLTASDKIAAYQQYLDEMIALGRSLGQAEATREIEAVNELVLNSVDSATMHQLRMALGGHVFFPSASAGGMAAANMGAADTAEKTYYIFVNGMLTDPFRAGDAFQQFAGLLLSSSLHNGADSIGYFYNPISTEQAPNMPYRRSFCITAVSAKVDALLNPPRWRQEVEDCTESSAWGSARIGGVADLTEAVTQYFTVKTTGRPFNEYSVYLADQVRNYIHAGGHVMLVGHSQGNMLIQQVIDTLRTDFSYVPNRDSTVIGAVALAAPTLDGWLLDNNHLRSITVAGDWIQIFNHDVGVSTALSRKRDSALARWDVTDPVQHEMYDNEDLPSRWALHAISSSYLQQPEVQQLLIASLQHLYREAAVGSARGADMGTFTIGATKNLALYVTVLNRNNRPLSGRRASDWNSSAPTIVSVDTAGQMQALRNGNALIAATARSRVTNPPFSILVAAPPDYGITGTWQGTWDNLVTNGTAVMSIQQISDSVAGSVSYTHNGTPYTVPIVDGRVSGGLQNPQVNFSIGAPEYYSQAGNWTFRVALRPFFSQMSGTAAGFKDGTPTFETRSWHLTRVP